VRAEMDRFGRYRGDDELPTGLDVRPAPVPCDLLLWTRVWAFQLDAGIEMMLGLGQDASQPFALRLMIRGRTRRSLLTSRPSFTAIATPAAPNLEAT